MGLGVVILTAMLLGCLVAGVASSKGIANALGAVALGLLASLLVDYLWVPIAVIGDPYFLESELRLAAIVIIPIGVSAFVGARIRKALSSEGNM